MKTQDFLNAKFGDHFSFIYKNEAQLFSVIVPFFMMGLEDNQKCIYIIDNISKERIISEFSKHGFDVKKFILSGQMLILDSRDTYLKNGYFDPDIMIETLRDVEKKALDEGYNGLRVTGEALGILKGKNGSEKIMEYESKLCSFFSGSKTIAICQYDETKINSKILAESIHCHPDVIFYDKRCENLYYSPRLFLEGGKQSFPIGSYELIKQDFLTN